MTFMRSSGTTSLLTALMREARAVPPVIPKRIKIWLGITMNAAFSIYTYTQENATINVQKRAWVTEMLYVPMGVTAR